jgi:6-phosphogluconolactonase
VALSGGSTPELLFSIFGDHYSASVNWEDVHFFWGDERCVAADDPESNYGMVKRSFFDKIVIPELNIHRIIGENDPVKESVRYSEEISLFTMPLNGLPRFDVVILGLGEDGHTASIFPGQEHLLESYDICDVAIHPVTGQKRITLTGRVLNNADQIIFMVTGAKKSAIAGEIINRGPLSLKYPAAHIVPSHGSMSWYMDGEAAVLVRQQDTDSTFSV